MLIKALVMTIFYLAALQVCDAFQIKARGPLFASSARMAPYISIAQNDPILVAQRQPQAEKIKGRFITRYGGHGLAGVSVSLYDAQRTLMDVTESDADGYFTLDLDVFDDIKRESIVRSYLEVTDVNGRKIRIKLSDVILFYARVVKLKDIPLP